ncbi:MAG: hypothetical protein ACXABY_25655 [Candidatus Thorarchaeota archaeon]|jgi:hypothetical protein
MEAKKHYYNVEIEFSYTQDDLDHMIQCSKTHYDGKCKAASRQGGFLYGMQQYLNLIEEDIAIKVMTTRELDTLCKILEQAFSPGAIVLHKYCMRQLRIAFNRSAVLNGRKPAYPHLPLELPHE